MEKIKILVLCGGGGTEHSVSLVSSAHIVKALNAFPTFKVQTQELSVGHNLASINWREVDYVIPCIHGYPGETGEIAAFLEMMQIPYLGPGPQASALCFNKVSTKLWLQAANIPVTPFIFLANDDQLPLAQQFLQQHGTVFVKAASQGSSVGLFRVDRPDKLATAIKEAFSYSPQVLIEKEIKGRELEISAYEFGGELQISAPGEILCPPDTYYSYQEKYSSNGRTTTQVIADNLASDLMLALQDYARRAFSLLKLRHLSRVDFFLAGHKIYLNEINTFPGLTPISMFPKMMEANGHLFQDFLYQIISKQLSES